MPSSERTRRIRRSACLAIAIAACRDPAAPPIEVDARPSGASVAGQPMVYSTEYSWSQGQPATHMGTNDFWGVERVCYLTRVNGRFTGYGESVRAYLVGNDWYLGGSSGAVGVGAKARCMLVLDYSTEYVQFPGPARVLSHGSKWMCFLTGVGGELSANYARTTFSLDHWRVYVNDGTPNERWIGVRCARPPDGDANTKDFGESLWAVGEDPVLLESDTRVCALTLIGGSYQDAGSNVAIFRAFGGWWLYGGNLGGPDEWQGARCFW